MQSRIISRVFEKMAAYYGNQFADRWRDCNLESVRRTWAEALMGYSIGEIRQGIQSCLRLKYAPTLPEFLKVCRPPLDFRSAYQEAVVQLSLRKEGRDTWSHPAIYYAARSIGSFEILQANWSQIERRWTSVLTASYDEGHWPPIPKADLALPAPGRTITPPEEARARLKKIRELLIAEAPEDSDE